MRLVRKKGTALKITISTVQLSKCIFNFYSAQFVLINIKKKIKKNTQHRESLSYEGENTLLGFEQNIHTYRFFFR